VVTTSKMSVTIHPPPCLM